MRVPTTLPALPGPGRLGPALILPVQPCPSTTHHGSYRAAAQALRASQLL